MLVILPREYSESLDLNYKNNQKNVFGMQCVIIFTCMWPISVVWRCFTHCVTQKEMIWILVRTLRGSNYTNWFHIQSKRIITNSRQAAKSLSSLILFPKRKARYGSVRRHSRRLDVSRGKVSPRIFLVQRFTCSPSRQVQHRL